MSTCFHPPAQFTKVEAQRFLSSGALPADLAARVRLLLEYPCGNCDDRRCMDCVLRYEHDECADSCPFCCDPATT